MQVIIIKFTIHITCIINLSLSKERIALLEDFIKKFSKSQRSNVPYRTCVWIISAI